MAKRKQIKEQGAALLILSYLTAITVGSLTLSLLARQLFDSRHAQVYLDQEGKYYLSEAGIELAIDGMRQNVTVLNQQKPGTQLNPNNPSFAGWLGIRPIGNGTVEVTATKSTTIQDLYTVVASSPTRADPRREDITSQILIPSFARFAYFADQPSASAWFSNGNELWGPVHINGYVQIKGGPVFHDFVTTSQSKIKYYSGTNPDGVTPKYPNLDYPTYDKGFPTLKVASKNLPSGVPTSLKNLATQNNTYWTTPTTVELLRTGGMKVTNSSNFPNGEVMSLPHNGIVYVEGGNVSVSGVVSGRVTVVSAPPPTNSNQQSDIVITNHLTYSCDPLTDPDCTNMLGLVANNYIKIDKAAPIDLKVQGVLMSFKNGLQVDVGGAKNLVPPKGSLNILGSVIEKTSYLKGYIDPSTGKLLNGYVGKYRYDERTALTPPPGFDQLSSGQPIELSRTRS